MPQENEERWEMKSDEIMIALLSRGYFPKELPDVFTTMDFGSHSKEIIEDWRAKNVFSTKEAAKLKGKKCRRGSYTYKLRDAEPETISKPKRGYERRNIHLTHPIPQALLCSELAAGWRDVQGWLGRGRYTEDKIRVGFNYERSLKEINFAAHRAKKEFLEASCDWIVKTDISRFYPTIYTHSIPWAAYGKEKVKADISKYAGSLADRLDMLVRACNRNQTIGIPIGPETSRVLAEIISSRIDSDFSIKCGSAKRAEIDRLQDDWTVGAGSLEKAEELLSVIAFVYRSFGLEINGSKTAIEHIVASRAVAWHSDLNAFLSHRSGTLTGARLREFLSLCLRLQAEHQSEPVVSYALAVVEKLLPTGIDVETYESFLLKAAAISPSSLDRICRIILNLDFKTQSISRKRICDRFSALAEKAITNGNLYEVVWLLYTIRGLRNPLSSKIILGAVEELQSSSVALILLDMKSKGLCVGKLPTAKWEMSVTTDGIYSGWIWLLGYEGIRHGWLNDKNNSMRDPFFAAMNSRDVVFYDPKKMVRNSAKVVRDTIKIRLQQRLETTQILKELRMLHIDTGLSDY